MAENKSNGYMKMVVDGKEYDVSFEEIAQSNNMLLEALISVLVDKKIIDPEELGKKLQLIHNERCKK